jgi:heme oxygenase
MENTGLMERLKDSTRAIHDSAESSQFQGHLTNGALPQNVYADYLAQLYLVHSYLEQEINKHSASGACFAGVLTSDQLQVPFLKEDLQNFGRSTDEITPLNATKKLLDLMTALSKSQPVALLGMHYVLLGSKHGGKFVARNCQEAYKLPDGRGAKYFDPYGPNFMPIWKSFKESMNNLNLNESDSAQTCDAAAKMFSAIGEIGAELMPVARKS